MLGEVEQAKSASFVLRLWLEPAEGVSPVWRWKVHHVQSGEEKYLGSLADVLDFVAGCAEVAPPEVMGPREAGADQAVHERIGDAGRRG